jgi:thymidine kinase
MLSSTFIDEAGFLSAREMRQLVNFAAGSNCRVIRAGGTRFRNDELHTVAAVGGASRR